MGRYFIVVLSLFLGTSISVLASSRGGESGGGGNGAQSTIQQVKDCVKFSGPGYDLCYGPRENIFQHIFDAFQPGSLLPVKDARARKILTDILALPLFTAKELQGEPGRKIFRLNERFSWDIRENDSCFHGNKASDASLKVTGSGTEMKAVLCLSLPRLTRYPKDALEDQIPALYVHELSHAAGYDEENANYIQQYFLNRWSLPCDIHFTEIHPQPWPKDKGGFYIRIDPMGVAQVDYAKYSEHDPRAPDRKSVLINRTINGPGDAKLKMSHQGGSLEFLSTDSDGIIRRQSISWGPFRDVHNIDEIKSSDIIVDGKAYIPSSLRAFDCLVR